MSAMLFPIQIAAILTLPFDVVKTRRQIQLGEMDTLGGVLVTQEFLMFRVCAEFTHV